MSSSQRPLLQAKDIRFAYATRESRETFELYVERLEVHAGQVLALCGPSGSGKSTLLAILAGLLRPAEGVVHLRIETATFDVHVQNKAQWRTLRSEIGFVSQDPRESLNDRRTVLDIVMDPLRIHNLPGDAAAVMAPTRWLNRAATTLSRPIRQVQQQSALAALEQVGITAEQALRTPEKLSGGQRQRVAIARALVCRPRLLFLDEPTSALDVSVQASIARLLIDLHQRDRQQAHILVTHDLALARQLADHIALLDHGRIVETGPTDQILTAPASPITQQLLDIARAELNRLSPP